MFWLLLFDSAIKSPQILELSGLGRTDVLSKIGVKTKVELPGVGENVQEHTLTRLAYEMNPDIKLDSYDMLRDPEFAAAHMQL